jgi:hypothetical protein
LPVRSSHRRDTVADVAHFCYVLIGESPLGLRLDSISQNYDGKTFGRGAHHRDDGSGAEQPLADKIGGHGCHRFPC